MKIDAGQLSHQELNDQLRMSREQNIIIENCLGQDVYKRQFQHGARLDLTGVGSQAHSPTLRQVPLLVRHQIDHRVGAFGIKLTGIRVAPGAVSYTHLEKQSLPFPKAANLSPGKFPLPSARTVDGKTTR